jgi:hypothetical protein
MTGGRMGLPAVSLGALERPELVELEPPPQRRVSVASAPRAAPTPVAPPAPVASPTVAPSARGTMVEDYEAMAAPRSGGRKKVVVGLLALALAGGAAAFVLQGKKIDGQALKDPAGLVKRLTASSPKPAQASAPEDVVWVKFNVVPAHSRIYVDGKPIPSNPAPLTKGQPHNVTAIADGYEIEQMDIKGTSVGTIHMRLEKKRSRR